MKFHAPQVPGGRLLMDGRDRSSLRGGRAAYRRASSRRENARPEKETPLVSQPRQPVDWVGILEAVYDLERPREEWLGGVLRAAAPLSEPGGGIGGVLYRSSSATDFHLDLITGLGLPPGWLEAGMEMHSNPAFSSVLARGYRRLMCASSTEFLGGGTFQEQLALDSMAQVGLGEALCVNGIDGSGLGCALYLFSKKRMELLPGVLGLLKRIASHLATAYRLHHRIASASPSTPARIEAIVGEQGQLLHAEGEAKAHDARSSLARAAERYRWAHGKARHEQAEPALEAHQCLVAGRWTLRERSEDDGKASLHAYPNQPMASGPRALSVRERQVASLAALGRSNKLIAYELGLAHSTVRVLIARAGQKIGAHSRAELIARLTASGTTGA
jgi:DNA-binding NarL/FixJ family response regulator